MKNVLSQENDLYLAVRVYIYYWFIIAPTSAKNTTAKTQQP